MAQKKHETFAFGSVLEALTKGLYPDKRHVLREFVQNAFDALRDLRVSDKTSLLRPIVITIDRPSITIYDEGIGMDEEQMGQYRYLGYSEKLAQTHVGFRGIGKYSGTAIAKRIIVSSTTKGSKTKCQVTIDAEAMFEHLRNERNPDLNQVLEQHTHIETGKVEKEESHFTFVELRGILPDSEDLFDDDLLIKYLSETVPVPFDAASPFTAEIRRKLHANVPDFFESLLTVQDRKVFRRFPANIRPPEFIPVYETEDHDSPLIAYCWYCQHKDKGQIPDRDLRGLFYRVKNFAVGDQTTTRRDFWQTMAHQAFYFFGDVHLCNPNIVPTSDRTDLEDNKTRGEMRKRCKVISQRLNRQAQTEAGERKFQDSLQSTIELVRSVRQDKESGSLSIAEKPTVEFQVTQSINEVQRRIGRVSRKAAGAELQLVKRGEKVVRQAQELLAELQDNGGKLFDVTKATSMGEDGKKVFSIVTEILQDEFGHDFDLYQKLIRKITARLKEAFS